MRNSNFLGCEGMAAAHQALLFDDSCTWIPTDIEVLEMIERWDTKHRGLERDFNEELSDRMKAELLVTMMPAGFQNSLIQQPDEPEKFMWTKERTVSIMEVKNAVNFYAVDADGFNHEHVDNADLHNCEEEIGAVQRGLVSSPGIAPSWIPATSRIPPFASAATRRAIPRRSAGRGNARRTVTNRRTRWTTMLSTLIAWAREPLPVFAPILPPSWLVAHGQRKCIMPLAQRQLMWSMEMGKITIDSGAADIALPRQTLLDARISVMCMLHRCQRGQDGRIWEESASRSKSKKA